MSALRGGCMGTAGIFSPTLSSVYAAIIPQISAECKTEEGHLPSKKLQMPLLCHLSRLAPCRLNISLVRLDVGEPVRAYRYSGAQAEHIPHGADGKVA